MNSSLPVEPSPSAPSFWQRNPHQVWACVVFVLTVAFTYAAFPPIGIGELAYVMLLPAVMWAYREPSFKLYASVMLGAQVVAWIGLLSWLHHVTWFGMFALGTFIGLLNGAWFLAVWWTIPRLKGHRVFLLMMVMLGLAGLWVMGEWLRGVIFGGFPWLPLAASQWERPLVLQAASVGGAWVVSFVLVCFNLGAASYVHRIFAAGAPNLRKSGPELKWALLLLVFSAFPFLGEVMNQQRHKMARIALVQPYIPQNEKWDAARSQAVLQAIEKVTFEANDVGVPEMIMLPEAVVPWTLFLDPNVQPWLESLAKRTGKPVLAGSIYTEGTDAKTALWYNGAFVIDPVTGLDQSGYAKRKLVPFGEFVPLRSLLGWLEKFVPIGGDFQPGSHASLLSVTVGRNVVPVGTLICYEDVFPHLARESVRDGAELLAVMTNNGWFGEGGAAYQHATHSVLRAVENRRPLVRVGNGGWSGWIDEFGYVRLNLRDENDSVYFRGHTTTNLTRDLRWVNRQSFYTQHGDWFLVVSAVLATLGYYLVLAWRPPPPPREDETVA